MVISDKLMNELTNLEETLYSITQNNNINEIQLENFLRNLERRRYNILSQINLYNKTIEFDAKRIKNVSDNYKIKADDNSLTIYIPEPMPSYRNLKTHAYKNIMANLTKVTKPYENMFKEQVLIIIKIFDKIKGWDVDNKYIKPIIDSLIVSKVIEDDNFEKMFYCVKGEFSENPHTEIYVIPISKMETFFENRII